MNPTRWWKRLTAPRTQAVAAEPPRPERPPMTDLESANLVVRQIDRWLAAMERLRLADYVRYVDDRRRLFWTSFWAGVARGVGMAVGFTILGAVLVLVLQDLARRNLPLIGDFLTQIMGVVQGE
ncbi:MAG: DUF5665 domain-containing protein [Candidatus Limiplasma sp.]|nr:DUF5665 domain-containing protein [Clostridiales bacterium]MDY3815556.1 DUF5665 domain-containing protein [Candidatus Limiplasma sp.]